MVFKSLMTKTRGKHLIGCRTIASHRNLTNSVDMINMHDSAVGLSALWLLLLLKCWLKSWQAHALFDSRAS